MKNNDRFYYDYDCLNKSLVERYQIQVFDNIKKYMNMFDEKPKYLKESKVIDFIDIISDMNIKEKAEIIIQNGMKGL